jgi:hypothetical protein
LKANGFGRPFLQSLSQQHIADVGLEFFMAAIVHLVFFWIVTPCSLLCGHQLSEDHTVIYLKGEDKSA